MTGAHDRAGSVSPLIADLPPGAVDAMAKMIVLRQALASPEFVAQFDRLSGTNLSQRGTAIEQMIDSTSGRLEADFKSFVAFVYDVLWDRAPDSLRDALRLHASQCTNRHP